MVQTLLRLLGIDLQQQISRLKMHVEEVTEQASSRIERQVQETGLTLGFALGGLIAALATVAIVLTAIFIWVDREHGPLVGLAVVGVITAVLAGLMFRLAATHGRSSASPKPRPRAAEPPPSEPPASSPRDLSGSVPPPPADADLLDVLAHRITTQAAAASDEAINTATEFVRSGSREQLVGALTLAMLVGILIGRKK
ncbi:MAG: hypothetical protein ACLPKB_16415 [Xanthobacteraceae bacterium]